MVHFEIPEINESIIKVIGVGGGGGNAVNHMYELGIQGVDFILCNTDAQALEQSQIPHKIQLGPHLTQGLGAGANPDIGRQAGEESVEEIKKILKDNTRMAFITAGMGGGTGTGAAPIIAKVCRELDILTVGIVTTPFAYEGRKRLKQAQDGINAMKEYVDTILIISNDKLRMQFGNIGFSEAFSKADSILSTAARCITDLITDNGRVNLDFNDVQTVMRNGGRAILGSAQADGEDRAINSVTAALDSPLLNDNEIKGAKWILLNITSGDGDFEHTLDELEIIQKYVQEKAGNNCDIILGMGNDPSLKENIAVTIIATGFNYEEFTPENQFKKKEINKVVVRIDDEDANEKLEKGLIEDEIKEEVIAPLDPTLSVQSERNQPVETNKPLDNTSKSTYFNLELPTQQEEEPQRQPYTGYTQNVVQKTPEFEITNESEIKPEVQDDGIHMTVKSSTIRTQERQEEVAKEPYISETTETAEWKENVKAEMQNEEERRFEEAKRHLELRAEKLRERAQQAARNYEDKDDYLESIPAYQRQNVEFEESATEEEDGFLSGYEVKEKSRGGVISTINSFLSGKRPD